MLSYTKAILGDFSMTTTADRLSKIADAAKQHKRVRIKYKKGTGRTVYRNIAAYSFRDGLLFVTDTQHGNKKIRSLKVTSIISAKKLPETFKPEWEITL